MQDIDERQLLRRFLDACPTCHAHFLENVGTILDPETEALTNEQVEAILISLNDLHQKHSEQR
jgi:hypothetical protein